MFGTLPDSLQGKVLFRLVILLLALFSFLPTPASAYSLLSHEAIIDVCWKKSIEPLLIQQFPESTAKELIEAHSYAYGGAIMPDIGYSPFGSMIYTNFVHNVRTGDYVMALLKEAENLNEYAFALGSLAHYMADIYGHMLATNLAVPLVYPNIEAKYGNRVTYADHKASHARLELAFDVLQTARGNYASKAYHDFIGFSISRSLVERAFVKTYGIDVNDLFGNMPVAISTFRWTIKNLLPNIVRTAWARKKSEIKKLHPEITARSFSFKMKNRTYNHEFGKDYQKAGFYQTIFSVLVPILPKLGPFAKFRFKTPSPEIEKLFMTSFDSTLVHYEKALAQLQKSSISLANRTLDTGFPTIFGEYAIADKNYKDLLLILNKKNFQNVCPEIRYNLISFYDRTAKTSKKQNKTEWIEISAALQALKEIHLADLNSAAATKH